MDSLYILAGPADCGNVFGYFKAGGIPAGKFAVVYDDEYTNGGCGPVLWQIDGRKLYDSEDAARAAMESVSK